VTRTPLPVDRVSWQLTRKAGIDVFPRSAEVKTHRHYAHPDFADHLVAVRSRSVGIHTQALGASQLNPDQPPSRASSTRVLQLTKAGTVWRRLRIVLTGILDWRHGRKDRFDPSEFATESAIVQTEKSCSESRLAGLWSVTQFVCTSS
jgi:hypothetical protein